MVILPNSNPGRGFLKTGLSGWNPIWTMEKSEFVASCHDFKDENSKKFMLFDYLLRFGPFMQFFYLFFWSSSVNSLWSFMFNGLPNLEPNSLTLSMTLLLQNWHTLVIDPSYKAIVRELGSLAGILSATKHVMFLWSWSATIFYVCSLVSHHPSIYRLLAILSSKLFIY